MIKSKFRRERKMKHCDNCNKDFDTEEQTCPICGAELRDTSSDETETAEIVSTMTITGIL